MGRSSAFTRFTSGAGLLLLGALGGCGLVLDFDYHAGSTGSGGCVDTSSDPLNCGRCGWDCLGGVCSNGECQSVVVVQGTAKDDFNHLILDDTTLYWTSQGGISSVAKDAPPMSAPSSTAGLGADSLAVDATNLYWADVQAGTISRAPKAKPTEVKQLAAGELEPHSLALGLDLYWSEYNVGGAIRTMTTAGAGLKDLVSPADRVLFLAPMGSDLFWTYRGDTDVHGGVKKLVVGTTTEIAKDEYAPSGLAVDATHAYWVRHDGTVWKAPMEGGSPPPAPVQLAPFEGKILYAEIVVDDEFVYWTGLHTVWRTAKDGSGSPEDFGGKTWQLVAALKMEGRILYWTTGKDAQLVRKVKRAPP